jgi:putative transposase
MTLPIVVGYFKMNTSKRINELLDSHGIPIWQRNYYEHIIRNNDDHYRIQSYIESNVDNWGFDDENPVRMT